MQSSRLVIRKQLSETKFIIFRKKNGGERERRALLTVY